MTKKINDKDKLLFRQAMHGVKPYVHSKITYKKHNPYRIKKHSLDEAFDFNPLSNQEYLDPVQGESILEFHRSGIHYKILRKLRTGQYNIDAILDLHGMAAEEANKKLQLFLKSCQINNHKMALIIHGKGRGNNPVLKNKLNHWLRELSSILAFCTALPKHGGSGALYILIKNL